jgi:hypothetical protein
MSESSPEQQARWAGWTPLIIDRIPLPYAATVAVATGLLLAEQVWEYSLRDPSLAALAKLDALTSFLAIPLVFLYCVVMVRVLRNAALRELAELQPSLYLAPEAYDSFVRRMVYTSRRVQAVVGLASAILVVVLWAVLRLPLPVGSDIYLPSQPLAALVVLACYVLFCWAGLILISATVQFGVGLGALASCRLSVNIFDPENLLPFGRLSLLHSMTAAGVIIILLVSLGPPVSALAWSVVGLASLASLSALVLPLRGVHRQMLLAKHGALAQIHGQFLECQTRLLRSADADDAQLNVIVERVETLSRLRKVVLAAASWPFRDLGSAVRALLAALSPLLYVILTEALRSYIKTFIH